jgi:hypothetical protein
MTDGVAADPSLSVVMVVGEERERARRAVDAVATQSIPRRSSSSSSTSSLASDC